jgi:hypothetical protein
MSKSELFWNLLTVIFTGYVVVMVGVTVFFTGWLVKEWFWPSPEWPERIAREIEEEAKEISLASWQEKEEQKTIL